MIYILYRLAIIPLGTSSVWCVEEFGFPKVCHKLFSRFERNSTFD